jgi:2-polyprenyl-3-methyl-5-hydroxy-6-metoxy-1,4-benzoquinol methylase
LESVSWTAGFRHRAQLTELMDEPCSREVLRACLRDIARTNRLTFAYRPLLRWLNRIVNSLPPLAAPLRILDVGCGYGDGLRRVERWAKSRRIPVELTGLDLNPDTISIAAEATPASSNIEWVTADVLTYAPPRPHHLVISSLFTHHLTEEQIVEFLKWMETHARLGWFISDLSRAPIPYYVFLSFAKLARLHHFVQNDGPVSIARSFVPPEWQTMCAAAGLDNGSVDIQVFKPARLCVARRKP